MSLEFVTWFLIASLLLFFAGFNYYRYQKERRSLAEYAMLKPPVLGEKARAEAAETYARIIDNDLRLLEARMMEGVKQRLASISSMFIRMKQLAGSLDKEEIFNHCEVIVKTALGAEGVLIYLKVPDTGELILARISSSAPGSGPGAGREIPESIGISTESLLHEAIGADQVITRKAAGLNPKLLSIARRDPVAADIYAPLSAGDQRLGALAISMGRSDLADEEASFAGAVASITGLVLKNADILSLTREELVSEKKISADEIVKRKALKNIFERFTTPEVVEEILRNPGAVRLGGEKKELSVFFADLRGFTSYSERHDPEAVVSVLNEYLSAMTEIVFEYGGTLDKFVGDEIMAIWGAPIGIEDHAEKAVRAGIAMIVRLKEIHAAWRSRGVEILDMGIGVNTGVMVVGNIGSEKRMDYTVIGDAVNLAARLEAITRDLGCYFLISEATYSKVEKIVDVRPVGEVQVKGKKTLVKAYEVLGLKNDTFRVGKPVK